MKKTVSIGLAFLLVFAIGLGLVGAVVAQAPDATATPEAGTGLGRMWGHMRAGAAAISEAVTDLLGLTQDEIHTMRLEGKTLAEIAKDRNVTEQQLIDAILTEKTAAIEQAVADGELTQAQADWLIARAKAMAPFQITNPFAGGRMGDEVGGRMGHGMSRGGMMGERGTGVCPNVTPEVESGTSS
jgi:predicted DNA-binding ribbon-helix-helix protein